MTLLSGVALMLVFGAVIKLTGGQVAGKLRAAIVDGGCDTVIIVYLALWRGYEMTGKHGLMLSEYDERTAGAASGRTALAAIS